jgi:uncharacterized metal-binding protein (TIGR02443 family)
MLKRRFIAGVVCPRCSGMDKIVMYDTEEGQRFRECVSCGFKEPFGNADEHSPDEVKTRVNQPRVGEKTLAHEVEVQAVKFVDAGVKRKDH